VPGRLGPDPAYAVTLRLTCADWTFHNRRARKGEIGLLKLAPGDRQPSLTTRGQQGRSEGVSDTPECSLPLIGRFAAKGGEKGRTSRYRTAPGAGRRRSKEQNQIATPMRTRRTPSSRGVSVVGRAEGAHDPQRENGLLEPESSTLIG